MKIALDEVESLLNIIEKVKIHDNRKLVYAGAGIKRKFKGYKPESKDRVYYDDARVDLYVVYDEDGEEYLTKLTQNVGYNTINYTNSAFKVEDLYDATMKITSFDKWEMNAQIKEFIADWKKKNTYSKVRYFTDFATVEAISKDVSKLKETVMFNEYTSEKMTRVEYFTNFMYYIENEFGKCTVNDIEKYKIEEFEDIDFIGWLLKSNKMGDYLEWRGNKTLLGGCIIQIDEGKVNKAIINKLEKDEKIRELKIKFRA